MICSPRPPYFFCRSMKPGISALQGTHHVAQKSRMITLPLNSDSETFLLSTSLNVKFSFAGLPFGSHAPAGVCAPADTLIAIRRVTPSTILMRGAYPFPRRSRTPCLSRRS